MLLADDETSASADRAALRAAGLRQVRFWTSGAEAALFLADSVSTVLPPIQQVIVCLPRLVDMSAAEFAILIRTHPLLVHLPLLAVTGDHAQETSLLDAGFNGVLKRPFNSNQLALLLGQAAAQARQARARLIEHLRRAGAVPPRDAFNELVTHYLPPALESMDSQDCCLYGKSALLAGQTEEAFPYLVKASSDPVCRGEACALLAVLWKRRNEPVRARASLIDAIQASVELKDWSRMRALTAHFGKEHPKEPFPLNPEVRRRVVRESPRQVLEILPYLEGLLPQDALCALLLQACSMTPVPKEKLAELINMLKKAGQSATSPDDENSSRAARQALGLAEVLQKNLDEMSGRGGKSGTFWSRLRGARTEQKNRIAEAVTPQDSEKEGDDTASTQPSTVQPATPVPAGDKTRKPQRKGIALSQQPMLEPLVVQESGSSTFLGDVGAIIRNTIRFYKASR